MFPKNLLCRVGFPKNLLCRIGFSLHLLLEEMFQKTLSNRTWGHDRKKVPFRGSKGTEVEKGELDSLQQEKLKQVNKEKRKVERGSEGHSKSLAWYFKSNKEFYLLEITFSNLTFKFCRGSDLNPLHYLPT